MDNKIITGLYMDSYLPHFEGVTICMVNYAKHLKELGGVFVVAPEYKDFDDNTLDYDVVRLKAMQIPKFEYKYIMLWRNRKKLKELYERPCDIIHVHSPFQAAKVAEKVARKKKIPIIATFHTKFWEESYRYTKSKFISNIIKRRCVKFFERCDSVWTVNNSFAQVLRDYGYKGKIEIVHNGTDYNYPENAEVLRNQAIERHNLEKCGDVFLFVGRLTFLKNIELSLKAMKLYKDRGHNFKFLLVGFGDDEAKLKKISKDLSLDENVIFVGKIGDRELLSQYYLAADLFIFPSTYDSDGLVKREAAVFCTPSVLIEGSNAAEGITDGVNGFTSKESPESLCDVMEKIMSDPAKLREVGLEASRTISQSWETVVDGVYTKYGEIIDKYNKGY